MWYNQIFVIMSLTSSEHVELQQCSNVDGPNLFAMLHHHVPHLWCCYPLLLCDKSEITYLHYGCLKT